MYVCNCEGINEKQVRQLVHKGHITLEELKKESGLASACGLCAKHAREIICEKKGTPECKNLCEVVLAS